MTPARLPLPRRLNRTYICQRRRTGVAAQLRHVTREGRPNVCDQSIQIRTVDAWVLEARTLLVAMCVESGSADGDYLARLTLRVQNLASELPRHNGRLDKGRVERVARHVQSSRGRAMI